MNSTGKRELDRRRSHRPDGLTTANGDAIPVWSAEATDPIAYLASVIEDLPGFRPASSVRAG